jgi:hypothetical protein
MPNVGVAGVAIARLSVELSRSRFWILLLPICVEIVTRSIVIGAIELNFRFTKLPNN